MEVSIVREFCVRRDSYCLCDGHAGVIARRREESPASLATETSMGLSVGVKGMTPYQRGNRDGLISFADTLEEMAHEWDRDSKRLEEGINKMPKPSEMHRSVVASSKYRAHLLREMAQRAMRASESLPHDPEEGQTDNREEPS